MTDVAHTALGDVIGQRADGVIRFHAVPYARPPIGALRFAPPQPIEPWSATLDARAPGAIAPQPPSRLRLAMGDFNRQQDEDCLTLAIATPAADDARRPVIVWLHGGAFLSGGGSLEWYDGGRLAQTGDAVVVGVNYRLGPLGYLYWPGLGDGLMGIQDMVVALRFVRDHISAFGGDPENVTLMGQSAGAIAIMRLLDMPETNGLFRRVIVQSGPPRRSHDTDTALQRSRRLLELLEIDPDGADPATPLRAVPAEGLATLQMQIARENARFAAIDPAFPPLFAETGDVAAFSTRVATACAERDVDVLLGWTREEMNAFFVADPAMASPDSSAVAAQFEALTGSAATIDLYRRLRPGADWRDLLGDLVTDHRFIFPAIGLAERLHALGRPAHLYEFSWAPAGSPWRACHCIDLPFVFGNRTAWNAPMLAGMTDADYDGLSTTMMAAWLSFARHGEPTVPDLVWPRYEPQQRPVMRFDTRTGAESDFSAPQRRQRSVIPY
ncbi:MAG: carboxylesterase family protein [Acetobacteraceae bacterium]